MDDLGQPLPRGRHGIDRDEIRANQRARIIEATIDCVAEQGYTPTTVGHIVARARVSRETFYELFSDKEECYGASLLESAGSVLTAFSEAVADRSRSRPERLETGLTAYFESLAARPTVTKCFILEQPPSRVRGEEERRIAGDAVAMLCSEFGFEDPFVVGAYLAMINGLVERTVRDGRTEDLPGMIPELMPIIRRVLEF